MNSTVIDSAYSDNAARMQEMLEFLRTIRQDSTINIIEVSFCGAASPEGSYQLNRKLAQGRLSALEKFIRSEVDIPDSLITYNNSYIPWDYLKSQIEDSGLIRKDEVITILEEEARLVDYHHPNTHIDNRVVKLRALDGGKVWQQICLSNQKQLSNVLDSYIRLLVQAKYLVDNKKGHELYNMFESSREYRNSMEDSSYGPTKKEYVVYCDLLDEAGGIAAVTTILAINQISIKNIGITHNREFEEGALRIEFYEEQAGILARKVLKDHGYTIHIRN